MELALSYATPSEVAVTGKRARVALSGARERPALRFRGTVRDPIPFREAMGALYDVVVSDFRWRPSEGRLEFEKWLRTQRDDRGGAERARPDATRKRFFESLYLEQRRLATPVLDPVVSVHPDEVFFEAFSRDGSSYGRVGLERAGFEETGEVVCGTTNVDFSSGLYESVRRLRSIFKTELDLSPAGVALTTGAREHAERKIDLPDAWIRGFLQLGAAFLLEAVSIELSPVHLHDLVRYLKLHRARVSPRALRWQLEPGQPAVLLIEPWEHRMVFHGSKHSAVVPRSIRVWGRQRLGLIERLLPIAESFVVSLPGRGLPYFVTARTKGLSFTLGLSGWTKNDWTATARFDALIARRGAKGRPSAKPLAWLKKRFRGTVAEIAAACQLAAADVHASLVAAASEGLVVFDLLAGVYRYRPLIEGGLPAGLAPGHDPREVAARELVARGAVKLSGTRREADGATLLRGDVVVDRDHTYSPEVAIGEEGGVARAECRCWFAQQHGLEQGLCEHAHALLLSFDEPAS